MMGAPPRPHVGRDREPVWLQAVSQPDSHRARLPVCPQMVGDGGNGYLLASRAWCRSRRPIERIRPRVVWRCPPCVGGQRNHTTKEIRSPICLERGIVRDLNIAERHSQIVDLLEAIEERS